MLTSNYFYINRLNEQKLIEILNNFRTGDDELTENWNVMQPIPD